MADPQTRDNLAQNPPLSLSHSHSPFPADPDPGHDPPDPLLPAASVSDHRRSEDPDFTPQPKRRKHCPTALENLDELSPALNSAFTFTFDTKFCAFAAEITPKFGSFNSIVQEIDEKREPQRSSGSASEMDGKGEAVRREEEEESEDAVAVALREAVGGLESVSSD